MDIAGKVFVVTGAGDGIGQQVALALLSSGAHVAGVDRSEQGLQRTAELAAAGPRWSAHTLDITDTEAVSALPAAVVEHHGQVDGLVHVAGIIQRFAPVSELSIAEMERVFAVNFWGTVSLSKAFLPLLVTRPEAALLNVSSMGGLVPVPGQGAYGASKAAVKLFTETLQAELRGSRVKVTVVFPGAVGTNITANSGVEAPKVTGEQLPKVTSSVDAGRLIVDAIERGTPRLLIGGDARMLDRMARIMPTRAIGIVADRMKALLG